jgi:predicted DNA-binding transcriptional regulator AlpA
VKGARAGSPGPPVETLYLTLEESGRVAGVSAKTITRWMARDVTFPAFRYGGIVRVNRTRFLRWLAAHEQGLRSRKPLSSLLQSPDSTCDADRP